MKKIILIIVTVSILGFNNSVYANSCPNDKPLFDGKECYSCDYPFPIVTETLEKCALCPEREYKTVFKKKFFGLMKEKVEACILKECGNNKFHNLEGYCLSCSGKFSSVQTTKEECAKCPNGNFQEGWCNLGVRNL